MKFIDETRINYKINMLVKDILIKDKKYTTTYIII